MSMDDLQRIETIIRIGRELSGYLRDNGITSDDILNDTVLQWTVTTPLYNIGEQVYWISDELKARRPDLPWYQVAGMRHRLVHDYESTNWTIVADAALKDIPEFISQMEELAKELW